MPYGTEISTPRGTHTHTFANDTSNVVIEASNAGFTISPLGETEISTPRGVNTNDTSNGVIEASDAGFTISPLGETDTTHTEAE